LHWCTCACTYFYHVVQQFHCFKRQCCIAQVCSVYPRLPCPCLHKPGGCTDAPLRHFTRLKPSCVCAVLLHGVDTLPAFLHATILWEFMQKFNTQTVSCFYSCSRLCQTSNHWQQPDLSVTEPVHVPCMSSVVQGIMLLLCAPCTPALFFVKAFRARDGTPGISVLHVHGALRAACMTTQPLGLLYASRFLHIGTPCRVLQCYCVGRCNSK
jgi:hypothetical protein